MSRTRKGAPLTPREMEYVQAISRGVTHHRLARQWGCSEDSARSTGHRVMTKLGAPTMASAIFIAFSQALIGPWEDCGTPGAYSRHFRRKVPLDAKCSLAHRRDIKEWRNKKS